MPSGGMRARDPPVAKRAYAAGWRGWLIRGAMGAALRAAHAGGGPAGGAGRRRRRSATAPPAASKSDTAPARGSTCRHVLRGRGRPGHGLHVAGAVRASPALRASGTGSAGFQERGPPAPACAAAPPRWGAKPGRGSQHRRAACDGHKQNHSRSSCRARLAARASFGGAVIPACNAPSAPVSFVVKARPSATQPRNASSSSQTWDGVGRAGGPRARKESSPYRTEATGRISFSFGLGSPTWTNVARGIGPDPRRDRRGDRSAQAARARPIQP